MEQTCIDNTLGVYDHARCGRGRPLAGPLHMPSENPQVMASYFISFLLNISLTKLWIPHSVEDAVVQGAHGAFRVLTSNDKCWPL